MSRALGLLALALAALAAGCRVDQAADVALYRDVVALEAPPEPLPPGAALSLEHALRLTNHANESLGIEGETYLQALLERQRAVARFLPTIDLTSAFVFREHVGAGGSGSADNGGGGGAGGGSADTTQFEAGIGGDLTLFEGFRNVSRLDAAEARIEQRRALLLDLRESLLLDTAQVYYGVLNAERLADVLRNSLEVQEERVRDARARHEAGIARPLDVYQSEAQASQTRVQLLDALNDARAGRAALAFLTGAPVEASPLTDGLDLPAELPTPADLLARAAAWRHDLIAAEAAARAARAEVDEAIGQYYPSVSVNLEYFLTRDAAPTDRDWTGLLQLNLPLFSGGRIEADVRAAWSRFRQAVLSYSLTRRRIRRDIEIAHGDLAASAERIEELQRQVDAAAEALRQAEASYEAGLGTNLERISAQDQLLTAQLQLAAEAYNQKVFYLAVLRAAGGLTAGVTGFATLPPPAFPPAEPPESPFLFLPDSRPDAADAAG